MNADDFGYTAGVNRAIFELHRAGALSSATLMARGAALEDAIEGLAAQRRQPSPSDRSAGPLSVGCHVVLVDGTSVLASEELPSLARAIRLPAGSALPARRAGDAEALLTFAPTPSRGSFRPTLGGFVADLLRGRISEAEIEREAIAQIRLLQLRGLRITHLDTHKHTHMFPRVLRPLLRAALRCGVRAIRNPFEPAWSLRATPGALPVRRAEVLMLSLLRPEFVRLVAEAGLRTTAGAIGVLATGTLDAPTLTRLLEAVSRAAQDSDATWELVCHPGYVDAALAAQATRLRASREIERAALSATLPGHQGFALADYDQLMP